MAAIPPASHPVGWAAAPTTGEVGISLKCEPELARRSRSTYEAVAPGYHLNKRHWNTVTIDGSVPDDELRAWIADSYGLVVAGLPRAQRAALER